MNKNYDSKKQENIKLDTKGIHMEVFHKAFMNPICN